MQRLLWPCLWLALGGCISQGTHDDLKRKYDEAQGILTERKSEIDTLSGQLAAIQTEAKQLHGRVAAQDAALAQAQKDHEREIAALTAEREALQEKLAGVVRDRSRLKEATKQLTDALKMLSNRKAEADRRVAEYKDLLAKFKKLIDAGKLEVRIVDGRMVLALPTDVLFDSGSAELSEVGTAAVSEVAVILAGMPGRRFQVEGHTDNVPINTPTYPSNWELSSARALGVVKAMQKAGMDPKSLSAAAFGEHHPVATNDSDPGRRKNRRIEVVLLPDLSMLPGFEELEALVNG